MEPFEFLKVRKFVSDLFEYIHKEKKIRYKVEYKYVPASTSFSSDYKKMILILYKDGNFVKDFSSISMNIEEGYSQVLYECFNYLIKE